MIKSDADGVVYVAGERPGAPGSTPPPIGTGACAAAGGRRPDARGRAERGPRRRRRRGWRRPDARGSSGVARPPRPAWRLRRPRLAPRRRRLPGELPGAGAGERARAGRGEGGGARGAGAGDGGGEASLELCRRAFGVRGDLPHCFGSARLDETALPLHTSMLFDRHFWLAKAVGALPSATPQTPWISPSPASRARGRPPRPPWRAAEAKGEGGRRGRRAGGRRRPGGRCAVCVVQKKGRCGTDAAPARCLRRGGRGRADALEDPFDDASEPPDEPFLATDLSASKAGSEVKAEGDAPAERGGAAACAAAAADAASGGFHRSDRVLRAAERREKPRGGGGAPRRAGKGRREGVDASLEPFLASSSSSSSSPSRRASRRRRRSWRTSRRRWTGTRRYARRRRATRWRGRRWRCSTS